MEVEAVDQNATYDTERYSRQMVLPGVGRDGQERLRDARVVILGLGALGSALADHMARAGVGHLLLVDRDYLELHNLQRQTLYSEADVAEGSPKAVAAARRLAAVNSGITITPLVLDVDAQNIEGLIAGATLVLDGSDNFSVRYLLNDATVKLGVPWIYSAVLGTSGMMMAIRPSDGPCLRCVYPDPPAPGSTPTCETAGVLGPAVALVAALAAAAALKMLLGQRAPAGLLAVDAWEGSTDRLADLQRDPECPCCGMRRYDFLAGGALSRVEPARLCGRETVQLKLGSDTLDTEALGTRLRSAELGQVVANKYLVRLIRANGVELTAFADGRVIVKGTGDLAVARGLAARYVGM